MTTQRIETADSFVMVETTVTVKSKFVDYDDIRAAVTVEPDDHYETPWDNCDGWEHDARELGYYDHDDMRESAGYAQRGWNEPNVLITLNDDLSEDYRFYRLNGASKQVAFERVAQLKRERLEQLVKWYEDGWEWWYVSGEFDDYEGMSCGGIDCADYAEDFADELADEIAKQMESDGFVVQNRPERKVYSKLDNWRRTYEWRNRVTVTTGRSQINRRYRRHIQTRYNQAVERAQSLQSA
jgi:hypothetical protein